MECGGWHAAREVSRRIDNELKAEKERRWRKYMQFLLWGFNDSGKSTFARQMKILYNDGFSKEEIELFKPIIHENIITSMKKILDFAEKHNLMPRTLQDSISAVRGSKILNEEVAEHIRKLWQDENIKKVWERRNEFNVMSNAEYYFNALDRIVQKDYVPTQDDILRAKVETRGIYDTILQIKGSQVQLMDANVTGTPRKWIHSFQEVSAAIFFVALDSYDMPVENDPNSNQLVESLRLFSWATKHRDLKRVSFAICFNKTDLFEEKLKRSPLSAVFPDYEGGADVDKAKQFICEKFEEQLEHYEEEFCSNFLYNVFTCAIDSNNCKQVFDALIQVFFERSLKAAG